VNSHDGLRVRAEPNIESEVLKVLPFGEEVHGVVKGDWMLTADGYVKAEYLSEEDPLSAYEYVGCWLTTAYAPTGCACANGEYPESGYTIACNSLDFGTEVFIQGIGFRMVEDRGPTSMPSEWLDIFMDTEGECIAYGEQMHDVWITKMP